MRVDILALVALYLTEFDNFKTINPKLPARTYESRSFKNFNKGEFRYDLKNVPWHDVEAAESVDDAVLLWERLYSEVADRHAPIK